MVIYGITHDPLVTAFAKLLYSKGANIILVGPNESNLLKSINNIKDVERKDQVLKHIVADLSTTGVSNSIFCNIPDVDIAIFTTETNPTPCLLKDLNSTDIESNIESQYLSYQNFSKSVFHCMASNLNVSNDIPKHILFISSSLAFYSPIGYSQYSPLYSSLKSFTDILRVECSPYNIKVECIYPGLLNHNTTGEQKIFRSRLPLSNIFNNNNSKYLTYDEASILILKKLNKGREQITIDFLSWILSCLTISSSPREFSFLQSFISFWFILFLPIIKNSINNDLKFYWESHKENLNIKSINELCDEDENEMLQVQLHESLISDLDKLKILKPIVEISRVDNEEVENKVLEGSEESSTKILNFNYSPQKINDGRGIDNSPLTPVKALVLDSKSTPIPIPININAQVLEVPKPYDDVPRTLPNINTTEIISNSRNINNSDNKTEESISIGPDEQEALLSDSTQFQNEINVEKSSTSINNDEHDDVCSPLVTKLSSDIDRFIDKINNSTLDDNNDDNDDASSEASWPEEEELPHEISNPLIEVSKESLQENDMSIPYTTILHPNEYKTRKQQWNSDRDLFLDTGEDLKEVAEFPAVKAEYLTEIEDSSNLVNTVDDEPIENSIVDNEQYIEPQVNLLEQESTTIDNTNDIQEPLTVFPQKLTDNDSSEDESIHEKSCSKSTSLSDIDDEYQSDVAIEKYDIPYDHNYSTNEPQLEEEINENYENYEEPPLLPLPLPLNDPITNDNIPIVTGDEKLNEFSPSWNDVNYSPVEESSKEVSHDEEQDIDPQFNPNPSVVINTDLDSTDEPLPPPPPRKPSIGYPNPFKNQSVKNRLLSHYQESRASSTSTNNEDPISVTNIRHLEEMSKVDNTIDDHKDISTNSLLPATITSTDNISPITTGTDVPLSLESDNSNDHEVKKAFFQQEYEIDNPYADEAPTTDLNNEEVMNEETTKEPTFSFDVNNDDEIVIDDNHVESLDINEFEDNKEKKLLVPTLSIHPATSWYDDSDNENNDSKHKDDDEIENEFSHTHDKAIDHDFSDHSDDNIDDYNKFKLKDNYEVENEFSLMDDEQSVDDSFSNSGDHDEDDEEVNNTSNLEDEINMSTITQDEDEDEDEDEDDSSDDDKEDHIEALPISKIYSREYLNDLNQTLENIKRFNSPNMKQDNFINKEEDLKRSFDDDDDDDDDDDLKRSSNNNDNTSTSKLPIDNYINTLRQKSRIKRPKRNTLKNVNDTTANVGTISGVKEDTHTGTSNHDQETNEGDDSSSDKFRPKQFDFSSQGPQMASSVPMMQELKQFFKKKEVLTTENNNTNLLKPNSRDPNLKKSFEKLVNEKETEIEDFNPVKGVRNEINERNKRDLGSDNDSNHSVEEDRFVFEEPWTPSPPHYFSKNDNDSITSSGSESNNDVAFESEFVREPITPKSPITITRAAALKSAALKTKQTPTEKNISYIITS